jgi:single-strand DNA-binding protein
MAMTNETRLMGNLGTSVERRLTKSGQAVANFRMATNEVYGKGDQRQKHTEWHRIVVFGKLAETCAQYLEKGSQVMLTGRLRTRKWTGQDGHDNYTTEVHTSQIQFLSRGKKTEVEPVEETQLPLIEDEKEPF